MHLLCLPLPSTPPIPRSTGILEMMHKTYAWQQKCQTNAAGETQTVLLDLSTSHSSSQSSCLRQTHLIFLGEQAPLPEVSRRTCAMRLIYLMPGWVCGCRDEHVPYSSRVPLYPSISLWTGIQGRACHLAVYSHSHTNEGH